MNEEDLLANAFYDEDYIFIKHITGKIAENQEQAEQIINEYLKEPRGRRMKFEIKQYQENTKKLKIQNTKRSNLINDNDILTRNVKNKYWDLERALKNKQYKEEKKIRETHAQQIKKVDKNTENLKNINQQYKRLINLRKLIPKVLKLDNYLVYKYGYPKDEHGEVKRVLKGNCLCYPEREPIYYEPIKILVNNEFLKMSCYITENDKPKNKYSLIVVGNSFFCNRLGESDKLLNNMVYSYGVNGHIDNANIRMGIKDFSSIKYAEDYLNKNELKILKDFRQEHNKLIEEYKEVIKNTNTTEWEIAVLEDEKYYFEHNYSHGEDEPRYKEVVKEIEQLKRCLR